MNERKKVQENKKLRPTTNTAKLFYPKFCFMWEGTLVMFRRSWVRIPAPYTGWAFFTFIFCKNVLFVCTDKNKRKEAGVSPFFVVKIN